MVNYLDSPPKNVIVRLPNWLGDLVMATPILTDLRHQWPDAKITALCQGAVGALIQSDPHIDELLVFKRSRRRFSNPESKEILKQLRTGFYDLGLLLTNSFSSSWLFWRGHVQQRIGYATHWRRWLLNLPISLPKTRHTQHLVLTYKGLLEPLGIPVSSTAPKLYLTNQETITAKERLSHLFPSSLSDPFIIGINPGAAYGTAKCWLPERFQQLTQRLLQNPKNMLLFFGDQAGAPLVNEICKAFPARVINLAGQTSLRELMALIQSCHLFLTNDSGPMHIASALGVPLVALFGSTNDVTTGPYHGGLVIHKHVECSPCYRRVCPIDFRCMKRIEVEEVYQALQEFIPSAPTKLG